MAQPPRRGDSPQKQALREALEDVVRQQAEVAAARRPGQPEPAAPKRSPILTWGIPFIILSLGAVAVVRPPFVFPPPPPAESRPLREASLRVAIYLQAQKVLAFQREKGRLPGTPAEAGATPSDSIRYRALAGGTFELAGSNGPVQLTYVSTQPADSFVGNSFSLLAKRRP